MGGFLFVYCTSHLLYKLLVIYSKLFLANVLINRLTRRNKTRVWHTPQNFKSIASHYLLPFYIFARFSEVVCNKTLYMLYYFGKFFRDFLARPVRVECETSISEPARLFCDFVLKRLLAFSFRYFLILRNYGVGKRIWIKKNYIWCFFW